MVAPINTSMMPSMAEIQKMQNFRSGSVNLSKDDFTAMQADMESKGLTTPAELRTIIDNYDKIDVNGDGMSFDELTGYAEENGIELKGPFGDKPPGPPPGGMPPGGLPPGGMPPKGGNGQGMSIDINNMQGSSNTSQMNILSSLLSAYTSTDSQETTNNFSVYL